jgi:NAD(P)-dependent dehydrogenase (short-subunit alcohol dehydrogenase family)
MSTVWVFGSTGSIGSMLCESLLERGDTVIAFTSSEVKTKNQSLDLTVDSRLIKMPCDLSTLECLEKLIDLSNDQKYSPDHLFFLARGAVPLDSIHEDETWGEIAIRDIMISLVTPIRIVTKLMSKEKSNLKTITMVSSQYALVAQDPNLYDTPASSLSTIYSAVRGGIISATRSLGVNGAKKGIRVNSLVLGGIKETANQELKSEIENRLPNGEMLSTRNACDWLLFLASEKSIGAVGSPIIVDNGWTTI